MNDANLQLNESISLYNSGISMNRIASLLNTNYSRIRRYLIKHGVTIRKAIRDDTLNWDKIIKSYVVDKKSLTAIAKGYNCSNTFIRNGLIKRGIKTRDFKEQITLDCKNVTKGHYLVNEQFFDEWSKEMAYVLGWIYSDGNIPQKKNTFRITSTDIEHLRNIANLFSENATITIRYWDKEKYPNYLDAGTLAICRTSMVKKLLDLGVTPAKSRTIKMPDVPDEYFGDFVRGVFEGDGCISLKLAKQKHLMPKINICSGSPDFLKSLGEKIKDLYGINYSIVKHYGNTWGLEYYSRHSMDVFFNFMYSDVSENMILMRKYNKFIEYFSNGGGQIDNNKHKRSKLQSEKAEKTMS